MSIKDNDFTWSTIMCASPSSLREEAGCRYDETDDDNPIWKWVVETATDEQLREIGEYALSNDDLWGVFMEYVFEAIRWGYNEFNKDLDNDTPE